MPASGSRPGTSASAGPAALLGLALLGAGVFTPGAAADGTEIEIPAISDHEASAIGARVYRNETGGRRERLLWWNEGESFASLGIGHFIWYPPRSEKTFVESLVRLGVGSHREVADIRSFDGFLEWVHEDLEHREQYVKTGWRSWPKHRERRSLGG